MPKNKNYNGHRRQMIERKLLLGLNHADFPEPIFGTIRPTVDHHTCITQALHKRRKEFPLPTQINIEPKEFGFIAQEVKELFPELVEQDTEGIYAVNYTGLIPVLVEAIKELQAKVEALENQGRISFKSGEATAANEKILDTEEYLSQNVPNPINGNARINYTLPEGTTSAAIAFYSINGAQVKNIPLDAHGKKGSITVSSADFASGLHIYKLIANGVVVGTKKLVNK